MPRAAQPARGFSIVDRQANGQTKGQAKGQAKGAVERDLRVGR